MKKINITLSEKEVLSAAGFSFATTLSLTDKAKYSDMSLDFSGDDVTNIPEFEYFFLPKDGTYFIIMTEHNRHIQQDIQVLKFLDQHRKQYTMPISEEITSEYLKRKKLL